MVPFYHLERIRQALQLHRAVIFAFNAAPKWMLISFTLHTIQGILPLLSLYILKMVIDSVTVAVSNIEKVLDFETVGFWIGLAAGTALVKGACQSMSAYTLEAQSLAASDNISKILQKKSARIDFAYYENPAFFDTLRRAQQEGVYRPTKIVTGLAQLCQNTISFVAMVGLLFSFSSIVGTILFISAMPGLIIRLIYSHRMYQWLHDRTPHERKAAYLNWVLTGDTYAKEIRLFGLGDHFIERFSDIRNTLRYEKQQVVKQRAIADFLAESLATLIIFSSFAWIAFKTIQGDVSIGEMVMLFSAFRLGLNNLRNILGNLSSFYEDNLFLSHFYTFLEYEPSIIRISKAAAIPRPIKESVEFKDVSFTYPGGKQAVIKGLSFKITPGEVVAIVGKNGSGKSTLVKLICRLYDPQKGVISIDGVDLRHFKPSDWRKQVSVIFQDYNRYYFSVGDNIRFGDIGKMSDKEAIITASQQSDIHSLIETLPDGYDTQLGKMFQNGEEMSMGQWQKIAIARMLFRKAQLFVLDEPSHFLDKESEYHLFNNIHQLIGGNSAILISHRLSTIRHADKIFFLDKGRILEAGSHKTLIRQGGKYAQLFGRQL